MSYGFLVCYSRAIDRDADVYLLDDPLSAVDTKVAHHLFQRTVGIHARAYDYGSNQTYLACWDWLRDCMLWKAA